MSSTDKKNIIDNELYPTPVELAKAFIDLVDWERLEADCRAKGEICAFIEPCKGLGNIYDNVPLPIKCYAEIQEGIDYLTDPSLDKGMLFAATITNPPFSLTEAFLRKSLAQRLDTGFVAYLQKVNFLGSVKRNAFWGEIGLPDKMIVATPRPSFAKNGTDSCEYAWLCWDPHGYVKCGTLGDNPTGIGILPWDKPSKRKSSKSSNDDTKK